MAVLLAFATPAVAAPSYLTRTSDGGYRVTYDYTDKAKKDLLNVIERMC